MLYVLLSPPQALTEASSLLPVEVRSRSTPLCLLSASRFRTPRKRVKAIHEARWHRASMPVAQRHRGRALPPGLASSDSDRYGGAGSCPSDGYAWQQRRLGGPCGGRCRRSRHRIGRRARTYPKGLRETVPPLDRRLRSEVEAWRPRAAPGVPLFRVSSENGGRTVILARRMLLRGCCGRVRTAYGAMRVRLTCSWQRCRAPVRGGDDGGRGVVSRGIRDRRAGQLRTRRSVW